MENQKKSTIARIFISAFVVIVILLIAYLVFDALGITKLTRVQIQEFVAGNERSFGENAWRIFQRLAKCIAEF